MGKLWHFPGDLSGDLRSFLVVTLVFHWNLWILTGDDVVLSRDNPGFSSNHGSYVENMLTFF